MCYRKYRELCKDKLGNVFLFTWGVLMGISFWIGKYDAKNPESLLKEAFALIIFHIFFGSWMKSHGKCYIACINESASSFIGEYKKLWKEQLGNFFLLVLGVLTGSIFGAVNLSRGDIGLLGIVQEMFLIALIYIFFGAWIKRHAGCYVKCRDKNMIE